MEQPQYPENQADVPQHQEETSTHVAETCELPKQQFVCDRCGKAFFSGSAIKAHIEVVHNGTKCKCEICGATMKWKSNLTIHMRKMHNVGDPPVKKTKNRKCQRCGIVFTRNSLLANHIRRVHKENPYKCEICGETFSAGSRLSLHTLEHEEVVKYTCIVCGMRYKTKHYLQRHVEKAGHEQTTTQENEITESTKNDHKSGEKASHPQITPEENEFTESTKNDQGVEKASHQQIPLEENVIAENTKNDQGLETARHQTSPEENVVTESRKKDKGLVCSKCNRKFTCYDAFRAHVLYNVNTVSCNQYRSNRARRKKHETSDTQCKCCAEVFDTPQGLKDHMNLEHGVQVQDKDTGRYRIKYPCPGCKKLLFANQLGYHYKMHAGIKDYSCDQCDYKCILEKDLRKHQLTHTDKLPFKCRFCCRQFVARRDMVAHENKLHLHIGLKPYQCNVCQRKFDDDQYCLQHQKKCKGVVQHEPELEYEQTLESRGFRCVVCSAVYSDQSALTNHRKKDHGHVSQKMPRKLNGRQNPLKNDNSTYGNSVFPVEYHHCPFCTQMFTNFVAFREHEMKCFDRQVTRGNASSSGSCGEGSGGSDNNNDGLSEIGEENGTKGSSYSAKTEGSKYQSDQECKGLKQEHPTTAQAAPNMSCINYCSACGKSTTEMIRQVCPSHQIFCSFCKKVFKSDYDLEAHLTTEHLDEHVQPNLSSNICSTCGKTTQELVQEHAANHLYSNDHSAVFEENLKAGMPRVVFL